jgi:hypothetical protein
VENPIFGVVWAFRRRPVWIAENAPGEREAPLPEKATTGDAGNPAMRNSDFGASVKSPALPDVFAGRPLGAGCCRIDGR